MEKTWSRNEDWIVLYAFRRQCERWPLAVDWLKINQRTSI